jgi:uncharacterized Tic20 family protein
MREPLDPIPAEEWELPTHIPSTKDDRTMALFCHLGGVLGHIVLPLVIWLIKKDQSRFVDDQGKEALNFQITMAIALVISGASMLILVGIVLFPAVWITNIVFSIIGAVAANKGEVYRYPITIRFIS